MEWTRGVDGLADRSSFVGLFVLGPGMGSRRRGAGGTGLCVVERVDGLVGSDRGCVYGHSHTGTSGDSMERALDRLRMSVDFTHTHTHTHTLTKPHARTDPHLTKLHSRSHTHVHTHSDHGY